MRLLSRLLFGAQKTRANAEESRPETRSSSATVESASPIDETAACVAAGRFSDALRIVDGALSTAPRDADLVFARASTLFAWGRHAEALSEHREAEHLGLRSTAHYAQWGWAAHSTGQSKEALESMRGAVASDPNDWAAHFGLATMLRANGLVDESLQASKRALELKPDDLYCASAVIVSQVQQGHLAEAEADARRAVALHADSPLAWDCLGGVLDHQRRFEEALAAYRRAAELEARGDEASDDYFNWVICLLRAGKTAEALELLESRLPQRPDARAQGHYAIALLTFGYLIDGWNQYEFRWMEPPLLSQRPKFVKPAWTGQSLAGRTLLLRSEQGFGDFFHFIRYAPRLKALGATLLLEVRDEVRPLAESLPDIDNVLKPNEPYPPFDFYSNLLSLPKAFGTDFASIPDSVPYLAADPHRASEWAKEISRDGRINVGLAWAGSPTHQRDSFRSLSLANLAPLAEVDGIRFHSLQKGPAASEAGSPPHPMALVDLGPKLRDFSDTAAAIDNLDLVIAVDTAVVHLAGALGKAVWVLVPKPADWRWLEEREDSPWYPTMRLFRQRRPGDWSDVIDRVATALRIFSRDKGRAEGISTDGRSSETKGTIATGRRPVRNLSEVAQTRHGIMQYFPRQPDVGSAIRVYGEHLQAHVDLLTKGGVAGATVIEAGAGVGCHALAIATAVGASGHLFLYEGDGHLRRALQQNLSSNGLANATVMRRTLRGTGPARSLDGESVQQETRALAPSPEAVFETIDELCLRTLNWLKINDTVDAAVVLNGAGETLWRLRPRLLIGAVDERELEKAASRARDFGYTCWKSTVPRFNPANFNLQPDDIFEGSVALAIVAVPEESAFGADLASCQRIG